jgi:hypothetical protein
MAEAPGPAGRFRAMPRHTVTAVRSRLAAGLLAALLAAAALGTAVTRALAATATSARHAVTPDVTVLFRRAVQIIHATSRPRFARAVVFEADGTTAGGRLVTSASGIVKWRFVFDNTASQSRFASATLFYGPPPVRFGRVKGIRSPFLEDVDIPRAPKMTLGQAVTLLRKAGFRQGFFTVTLRNPLGPKRRHPNYIFGMAGGTFIGVDTVTKRVSRFSG